MISKSTIKFIMSAVCIIAVAVILVQSHVTETPSVAEINEEQSAEGIDTEQNTASPADEAQNPAKEWPVLNIYTYDKEFETIVYQYAEQHPEFKYKIEFHENDPNFFYDLNHSLQSCDGMADIYYVPAGYAQWYIKGDYSKYACTYKELGIDVDAELKKADIPQPVIDDGTNPDGELISLPYKSNVNLFVYRRSIAREVWGTDDPNVISGIIGASTGRWDKFLEAAQTLREHDIYIIPTFEDLRSLVDTSIPGNEGSNRDYPINPAWEEFMDISKNLFDLGCMKDTLRWTDQWLKELDGKGDKPVFGTFSESREIKNLSNYFGKTAGDWGVCLPPTSVDTGYYPDILNMDFYGGIMVNKNSPNKDAISPLIEWITLDASENGLQYRLANDAFYGRIGGEAFRTYGGKRSVASGTVMKNIKNNMYSFGGQDINAVIYNALKTPTGKLDAVGLSPVGIWVSETEAYLKGEKDKETAIADFKAKAVENEKSDREWREKNGFSEDGKLISLIGKKDLNIYSYDDNLAGLVEQYVKNHPEFNFRVNWFNSLLIDYYSTLSMTVNNMESGNKEQVDIYCFPDAYTPYFVKGSYSIHACTYKELGIDVDAALEKADIPQYIVDAGKNPDGELISLPFRSDICVFMYRRSIAREVWGTDDPDKIGEIIGAGTVKWDKFFEAAQTLKEHGCYIVPGFQDLSFWVETSNPAATSGSGDYPINPKWEEFMDISKTLLDKGYITDTQSWTEQWLKDLKGEGDKIFGLASSIQMCQYLDTGEIADDWAVCLSPFRVDEGYLSGIMVNKDSPVKDELGPLIEWLTLDSTETGLQYGLATGSIGNGDKTPVISGTVLKNTDGSRDFLGKQDINPLIYKALQTPALKHQSYTSPEANIFYQWIPAIEEYLRGDKDKEAAIADFKTKAKETESYDKKMFEDYGMGFLFP